MFRYKLSIIFLVIINLLSAQDFQSEKKFIEYLIKTENYDKAIYAIDHLKKDLISESFKDSMNFLKASSFFALKSLDSSAFYFQKVKLKDLKAPATMLASYSFSYLKDYDRAIELLNNLSVENPNLNELKYLQLSGISLLKRDTSAFRDLSKNFRYEHFALVDDEATLNQLYTNVMSYRPKSYVAAGIMSAVVPGMGKVYAGKTGEGIYSFLINVILAAITYENYQNAGPTNIKTIFFGSMFATFYIGNIYGSVADVKKYRYEFNYETDYRILFHMHLPLRNFFF